MTIDLALVWAGLIAFAVLVYVLLDGFDLGIGVLFPLAGDERQRDQMMNAVAPIWDGNETWLVLGGGGLLAAFPLAYSVLLSALYVPILTMLLGLVLRGVAFEYRHQSPRQAPLWNGVFFIGSTLAAFCQGIVLGALVAGIPVANRAYAGDFWDWLTPFSLLTGIALVIGYALLGATWLVLKTEGELQSQMRVRAKWLGIGTLGLMGTVSLITPFLHPQYFERWFNWPKSLWTLLVPLLILSLAWSLFSSLYAQRDLKPYLSALGLFVASFVGILISFYPNLVPPGLTIWNAAAPSASLEFTLIGAAVLLPIILGYTSYAYYVFRGKVNVDEGYH